MIQDLYPKHQEKVAVINCGLDITWWQSQLLSFNLKERKEVKEKIFNAPENTLIIVTVGELHKRKGHDILIKAMSPLVEKFPNIKLAIVGEGEERNNLEALIKKRKLAKNVILTGRQGNIPHIMTSSDIFVLPSRREAFGIVNLEAMFCGLPIIAHKLNGTTDIIEEGKSGFLVDQKEPNQLAEALEFMIKNENLRTKMGLKGHMTVKNKFSAKQMAKAYEEIYKNS
jgi:glycosyltransferase involved in cell wall biosynthesis